MLAMLFGCGLRRSELVGLQLDDVQMRQAHWAIVDLIGKGGHIRTVPTPVWVKAALDEWTEEAGIMQGRIFRAVDRGGKMWGNGVSQDVVWYVVKTCCERAGLQHIAPHDLRTSLCQALPQRPGANWSRSSSSWAMHPCRRRNAISAANKISGHPVSRNWLVREWGYRLKPLLFPAVIFCPRAVTQPSHRAFVVAGYPLPATGIRRVLLVFLDDRDGFALLVRA